MALDKPRAIAAPRCSVILLGRRGLGVEHPLPQKPIHGTKARTEDCVRVRETIGRNHTLALAKSVRFCSRCDGASQYPLIPLVSAVHAWLQPSQGQVHNQSSDPCAGCWKLSVWQSGFSASAITDLAEANFGKCLVNARSYRTTLRILRHG